LSSFGKISIVKKLRASQPENRGSITDSGSDFYLQNNPGVERTWLKRYATSRQVAGSTPDGATSLPNPF
jgi:hypothetical protein